jgi:hypothetical protein
MMENNVKGIKGSNKNGVFMLLDGSYVGIIIMKFTFLVIF